MFNIYYLLLSSIYYKIIFKTNFFFFNMKTNTDPVESANYHIFTRRKLQI